MKKSILYMAAMLTSAVLLGGCEGDLEYPPMIEPEATIESNTKIADLKAMYWQTTQDYVTPVGQNAGHDIIIAGRVISSDKTGNIFKNIVLQDNTGAITISINAYDLYQTYQQGQQVVVNVTGLHIGGYVGLMQIGAVGSSYQGNPQTTFLDSSVFAEHAQQNGLARLERIDTIKATIPELMTAKGSVDGLQKWQSQLVRIDGVSFVDAGQQFAGTSNANRYVKDASGNQINVRNSSYADFSKDILPSGTGSVVGILSYYNNDWQVLLNDIDGLYDFEWTGGEPGGNEPEIPAGGDGTETSPFNCAQIIALNPTSTTEAVKTAVWVDGYIVGYMPTGGSSTLLSGTVFAADASATTTNLVIGPTADCKDVSKCVGVQLPTAMRDALALANQPGNLGKKLSIQGDIMKYCGGPGVKNLTAYDLEGGASVTPPAPAEGASFKAVTDITSGKSYVIVADGKVAKPLSTNYGYLQVADVTVSGDIVTTDVTNAFTFEAVSGGYTIKDSNDRYVFMTYKSGTTESYNSFNVDTTLPATGGLWTVTFDNGTAVIGNVEMSKTIQYDAQYTSYGSYPDVRGTYPTLYEKVD